MLLEARPCTACGQREYVVTSCNATDDAVCAEVTSSRLFTENASVFASLLRIEVLRAGLTLSTIETVRTNALRGCVNCTMEVVGFETQNRTVACEGSVEACFAAAFAIRRRLLQDGDVVFISFLVLSGEPFVPTLNVTCPAPCIAFTAHVNAPVVYTAWTSRQDFIGAVGRFFAVAPQPSARRVERKKSGRTEIIGVVAVGVCMLALVVAGLSRDTNERRLAASMFAGVAIDRKDM